MIGVSFLQPPRQFGPSAVVLPAGVPVRCIARLFQASLFELRAFLDAARGGGGGGGGGGLSEEEALAGEHGAIPRTKGRKPLAGKREGGEREKRALHTGPNCVRRCNTLYLEKTETGAIEVEKILTGLQAFASGICLARWHFSRPKEHVYENENIFRHEISSNF